MCGGAPLPPGSHAHLCGWVKDKAEFYASGLVWDVPAICKDFKIADAHKVCWPFYLTRKQSHNRLSVCGATASAAHKDMDAPAHSLKGFHSSEQGMIDKY